MYALALERNVLAPTFRAMSDLRQPALRCGSTDACVVVGNSRHEVALPVENANGPLRWISLALQEL